MSLTMYQTAVPPIVRALGSLRHVLAKGSAHCEAHKIDEAALIGFRLYPDMRPLVFQVQIAGDIAKGCVARLTGIEAPKFEDTERSFAELDERLARTLDFVKTATPAQFEGSESRSVVLKTPRGELKFEGLGYLQGFVLPNVYFHCTTAYNILRHNGVALGKMDYLGSS